MEYSRVTTPPSTSIALPTSIALHNNVLEDGRTDLMISINQYSKNYITGEITGHSVSLNMNQFSHVMFLLKSVETGLVNHQQQMMTFETQIQPLLQDLSVPVQDLSVPVQDSSEDCSMAPPPAPQRKRGNASRSSRTRTKPKKESIDIASVQTGIANSPHPLKTLAAQEQLLQQESSTTEDCSMPPTLTFQPTRRNASRSSRVNTAPNIDTTSGDMSPSINDTDMSAFANLYNLF